MARFANILGSAASWLSGAHGDVSFEAQRRAPAQDIFDLITPRPQPYTLDEIIDLGISNGRSVEEMANWENVKAPGITVEVTASGIETLRSELGPQQDQPLIATGAEMQWQFNPYTTMYDVEATLQAIASPTEMKGATFVSIGNDNREAPLNLGTMNGVNLDGFSVIAPDEGGIPRNVSLRLENSTARNGDFAGLNNRLTAEKCDVSELNASGSRAMALELRSCTAESMQLDKVTLAPGSGIEGCNLSGSIKDSVVGDLSLQNSYLMTPEMFEGTDISGVNFGGAIPRSKDVFAGAKYNGQELTGDALNDFWQDKSSTFGVAGQASEAPQQQATAKETSRGAGDMASLASTDGLLNALCEARGMLDGVCRTASDMAHDSEVTVASVGEGVNTHIAEDRGAKMGDVNRDPSLYA